MNASTGHAASREVVRARRVAGDVRVPGDKSISHRAALFNLLAEGQATISNFSTGADCASTLACVEHLGARVQRVSAGNTVRIAGTGRNGVREPGDVLDCGNSGTTMRLLCGLLAGQSVYAVLTGDASLRQRPMARVAEPLRAMGASISGRDDGRLAPLTIQPAARGGLRGVEHRLPIASAQVKSALVLAGLAADQASVIHSPSASRDHTERMLAAMGADITTDGAGLAVTVQPLQRPLRATDVTVPGDFSSAAFWLVLACLHRDASSEVRVRDVGLNPTRTGLLEILEGMGANVRVENARDVAGEPVGDVVARSSRLRGTTVDGALVTRAIDEMPLVALLGALAEGETVVRDARELRVKESDRITAIATGLSTLGVDITPTADGWRIRESTLREAEGGGDVASQGDHRVAMVLALAGALGEGARIAGAESVDISYPGFWQHLALVSGS